MRVRLESSAVALSPNMVRKVSLKWLGEAKPASMEAVVRSAPSLSAPAA